MRGLELWKRLRDEAAQALTIAFKDIRIYYLTPPMIMFGLILPVFLFLSFSVRRQTSGEMAIARLLAMNVYFTASSAGPVIIPMERRAGTYDRLLVAPLAQITLLVGKVLVGMCFALLVSAISVAIGLFALRATLINPGLAILGVLLSSGSFAALGVLFGSVPSQSVGSIMMPSTLIRWPLLFVSGVFVPLTEMSPWLRPLSYLSPLTYTQDLLYRSAGGPAVMPVWLCLVALPIFALVCLWGAGRLHQRSRELGY